MNDQIKTLLNKPMDRKDFLKHVGVGALFVAGGGMILNAMNLQQQRLVDSRPATGKSYGYGYGAAVYGGNKVQG